MLVQKTFATFIAFGLALVAADGFAQSSSRNAPPVRRPLSNSSRANIGASNVLNRPTVSPYLNLLGADGTATGAGRYQTLVRPQLDFRQRQFNNNARFNRLQQDVQRVSTAIGGVGQQSRQRYPFTTGHPSVYQNGSHYYPQLGR